MQKLFDRISRKLKAVLFGHYRPDFNSAWLEQNGHAMYCEVVVDHDRGHPLEFSGKPGTAQSGSLSEIDGEVANQGHGFVG